MEPFPDLEAPLSDGAVLLRRFTLADVGPVTLGCQDPEIARWTASIPVPYAESDARAWIESHAGRWSSGATASLAIVDAADGTFLGCIDVIVPRDAHRRAAVGYWVAAWGRSRGVATRSLLLASRWAIEALDVGQLYLETLEGNVASERVAEKAGYVCTGYRSEGFTRPPSRGTPETLRVKVWVLDASAQPHAWPHPHRHGEPTDLEG